MNWALSSLRFLTLFIYLSALYQRIVHRKKSNRYKAHDTKNTTGEQAYFDINVGLTQKIFEHFLQSGASKFIFFSSVKAAADTVQGEFLTEETEPSPGTPYGRSKLAAENYLLQRFSSLSKTQGSIC